MARQKRKMSTTTGLNRTMRNKLDNTMNDKRLLLSAQEHCRVMDTLSQYQEQLAVCKEELSSLDEQINLRFKAEQDRDYWKARALRAEDKRLLSS